MTTILLTGFEPFGGDRANPSGDAVRLVERNWSRDTELQAAILPVAFASAGARLNELITATRPDIVLATGLAGGRSAISVERVAINLLDARIPDNDGEQPIDVPSVEDAPAAYFSTLPIKAIRARITSAGIPAEVSYYAGTFVCNHVFFRALHDSPSTTRAGFIHVPWATGQAPHGEPELPTADLARALEIAVQTALDTAEDLTTTAGTLN